MKTSEQENVNVGICKTMVPTSVVPLTEKLQKPEQIFGELIVL